MELNYEIGDTVKFSDRRAIIVGTSIHPANSPENKMKQIGSPYHPTINPGSSDELKEKAVIKFNDPCMDYQIMFIQSDERFVGLQECKENQLTLVKKSNNRL
ncbi:hypothetical protein Paes_2393 (plasmid) [Prosthecochloris aestuarii DSM 271]|uniref:Uncharacterized protein n=1 Tax=Prosthecochloris aestuarii (strain DSM 271 / SK 413) TaxID=290512 RepID=B4S9Q5_PROA2|nr:hypothetical protein [Prosthecochloris aestuarii]ACF47382.1 hypothetical protein Paes_2393 [Prosthecochloris aestuarii DSM 271]